jgi:hypothetical protein
MTHTEHQDLINRLTRMETRFVRGFEELGVDTTNSRDDWLTVDDKQRVLYVSTLGRSLAVVLSDMQRKGATQTGKEYDIVHKGNVVASITYNQLV